MTMTLGRRIVAFLALLFLGVTPCLTPISARAAQETSPAKLSGEAVKQPWDQKPTVSHALYYIEGKNPEIHGYRRLYDSE